MTQPRSFKTVEGAVEVPDGVKDFFGAFASGRFALFDACPGTEFAFGITDVSGGD